MKPVHLYVLSQCPYCIDAKNLLDEQNIPYTETIVDNRPDVWKEMETKSNNHTAPQIFIDNKPIGGYTELKQLQLSGEIIKLLQ